MEIPRWIGDHLSIIVHVDGSKKAYAAVAYLRVENKKHVSVTLIVAKARVNPIKKPLTIPRTELAALELGVDLSLKVKNAVMNVLKLNGVNEDVPIKVFSDSTIALSQIATAEINSQTYVRNRVKSVHKTMQLI